ncbi:omega-conotoxin-like protein 1 [Neodiprion pinetum]|uniref:omega-conotoxin-like protein 1 n=1 Tax=Neodiprion pinetum TaxID=441929 RepID=UPI001EE12245|nr:omega-conotoxin-like protein 1 [Neodiprion pinetum]
MSKLLFFVCIVMLVGTVISATTSYGNTRYSSSMTVPRSTQGTACGRHGDSCVGRNAKQCCSGTSCHPYAGRCQARITEADLAEARFKILGTREKAQ